MYGEAVALRMWDGRGAVRLLAHDPRRHAMLLQRCEPGDQLAASAGPVEETLRAGCAVLRQLWQVAPPAAGAIEDLAVVTAEWADLVEERMVRIRPGYDPGLIAEGTRLLRELPSSAVCRVLLHGDFNPSNVLSCGAGLWAAIDPKPMIGDPAYDPWPLLEQLDDPFAYADRVAVLRSRLDLMSGECSLDTQRITLWAVARLVETALWAADQGDVIAGADAVQQARVLLGLS